MQHLNALDQVTLDLEHLTITGFSISGLATYVHVRWGRFQLSKLPTGTADSAHMRILRLSTPES